jgi:glycosyltransferase involved in cell wall biosynthesis
VYAPSKDTAARIQAVLQVDGVVVRPHGRSARGPRLVRSAASVAPVVVLGAIGDHKGYQKFVELVRYSAEVSLPLHFHVVGYTRDDAPFQGLRNVDVTGPYKRDELPALFDDAGAIVALFLSPWPETFCYALSEALDAGLYPITLDTGAFRERIETAQWGKVVPVGISVRELAEVLLRTHNELLAPGAT